MKIVIGIVVGIVVGVAACFMIILKAGKDYAYEICEERDKMISD